MILLERVARELFGEPTAAGGDVLRFRQDQNLRIDLIEEHWYDYETEEGGDALALVRKVKGLKNGEAETWVAQNIAMDRGPDHSVRANGSDYGSQSHADNESQRPQYWGPELQRGSRAAGSMGRNTRTTGAVPHNIEAEQALLGAILMNNDAYGVVASRIGPDDFFEPLHAETFRRIGAELQAGRPANPVTLKDALPDFPVGDITVPQYLARLASSVTSVISAPDYAQTVADLAAMRSLIGVTEDLSKANSRLQAPSEALREAWDRLDQLRASLASSAAGRGVIDQLADIVLEQDDSLVVTTGFQDLDAMIGGGYRAKRLVVIGGRPSMGKTIIACSSARRAARSGAGISMFSLETDKRELIARLAADELARTDHPLDYRDIVSGNLNQSAYDRLKTSVSRLKQYPIMIDETAGLSIVEIEARARMDRDRFARQGITLGVVLIDYLGLIRAGDRYRGRKVDEIGEITQTAKQIAKRLDVCVVLMAQLNREVEKREDKRPSMADLRESGNIEQDADIVGLLYRPAYYAERQGVERLEPDEYAAYDADRQKLEFIIGKNRLGPAKTVPLKCEPKHSMVDDWR